MLIGHQIIQLLYTDATLNDANSTACTFAIAFHKKLAHCIDNQNIIMEWAIVAILDARYKLLGKFRHLFDTLHSTKWLVNCSA